MRLEYFWVKQITETPMENKTRLVLERLKWKWIVPMEREGGRFLFFFIQPARQTQ